MQLPDLGPDVDAFADTLTAAHAGLPPDTAVVAVRAPEGTVRDAAFRRFVVGLWATDIALYPDPDDRCDLAKLLWACQTFPAGFRLWCTPDGMPVGYTGWHPIPDATFALLRDAPGALVDRGQITAWPAGRAVYLFNYGIAAPLRRTSASRSMLRALAEDIAPFPDRCAVCVSPEGEAVAARFGLRLRGAVPIGRERAWTT